MFDDIVQYSEKRHVQKVIIDAVSKNCQSVKIFAGTYHTSIKYNTTNIVKHFLHVWDNIQSELFQA